MNSSQPTRIMVIFTMAQRAMCNAWEFVDGMIDAIPLADGVRAVCDLDILRDIPPYDINPYKSELVVGTLPEGFATGYDYFMSLPQETINPIDWPDPL